MATHASTTSAGDKPFFGFQQERAAALQKELLESYEQTSRAWLERVQSEATLWSDLAAKLAATRSFPDAIEAYTQCVSQQIKMTAEDGQRLINDCQQMMQKISRSFATGGPTASR